MRILTIVVFFLGLLVLSIPAARAELSVPSRIVTHYALTSTHDYAANDPSAWRLLGSNDGGKTWALLDVRTNQTFGERNLRRDFAITNQTAYNVYRLQIDACFSANGFGDMSVELADLDLVGQLVGVENETNLQPIITSSDANPLMGPPENAFDNDIGSYWMDYGLSHSGKCWIQCQYELHSELLVTNITQARLLARLSAMRDPFLEKGPQILANLAASAVKPLRTVTGYALTSANDAPERDPRSWRLLGSNNGGQTWRSLDERTNEIFSSRFQRRFFELNHPASYATYRLEIDGISVPGSPVQLAEIEPLYDGAEKNVPFSLVVSADGENAPAETCGKAFDSDPKTKWLDFFSGDLDHRFWIQWQYIPQVEDLPVINLRRLEFLTGHSEQVTKAAQLYSNLTTHVAMQPRVLTGYSLTSADDSPARDPRDWRLLASNDGGKTWKTLDTRTNEFFSKRLQKLTFALFNQTPYALYRLKIDSIRNPGSEYANAVQLSEIEPSFAAGDGENYSTIISSQGENGPGESNEKAFDGKPGTKWLDFCQPGNTNRTSWIQWYYAAGQTDRLIDLDRLREDGIRRPILHHSPSPMKLQLAGVVVSLETNLLGFLDQSGFQLFQLGSPVTNVRPGERIQLSGRLRFGRQLPVLAEPKAVSWGTLASVQRVKAEQPMGDQQFLLGTGLGTVTSISDDGFYSTFALSPETGTGQLTAKIFNPQHAPTGSFLGRRIFVEGVVEPVFEDNGGRVAGNIWASNLNAVAFAEPVEPNPTTSLQPETPIDKAHPVTDIRQVNQLLRTGPTNAVPATIRGVITYVDLNLGTFYIQDGSDNIMINDQMSAGVSPLLHQAGSYVELPGTLFNGGFQPTAYVKVLGVGRMPEPLRHSWDYLMTGRDDGNWVQLDGVVSALEFNRLTLAVTGGRLIVWVNELDRNFRNQLLGSVVRIDGVCSPVVNSRNQRLGQRLLVPSSDYIQIEKAAPENPFDMPTTAIGGVMQAGNGDYSQPTQLTKTTGIVTYSGPGVLFVQDKQDGIRVVPRRDVNVEPGDRVEVVGLAEPDGLSPKLVQALVRKVGQTNLPAASPVDLVGIYSDSATTNQDATRGQIEATFLGGNINDTVQVLELQSDTLKKTSYAFLPVKSDAMPAIPVGSRIRLEGVFKAVTDTVPDSGQVVASFEMYLNSPADITILSQPSWWNTRHTLWVLGGLGTALFLVLAWVGSLRRRVQRRTRELHEEIEEHKRTEAQLQEEIAERKRAEKIQETMFKVSQAMHTTGSLDDLYREIHGVLRQSMPADNFFIALHDPAADTVTFPYFLDQLDGDTNPSRKCGWGLTEYVLRTGKAIHATRKEYDALTAKGEIIPAGMRPVDWLGVPLMIEDRTVGVMAVQSYTEGVEFRQTDLDILQFSSTQAATAIERKRAEAELAYERDLLRTLLDSSPDRIYFKDKESRFIKCSKSLAESFAAGEGEIIGKSDADFFTEEYTHSAVADEQEIIRTGKPVTGKIEKESWKNSDRITWVLTTKVPLCNKAGEIIGTFGISKDITAIKEAEAKLNQVHKQLLAASRVAGMAEVATSVLHNVGNVLNSVNVSGALVSGMIRDSKVTRLANVTALMEEHAGDLPGFFADNPKGKALPGYLSDLAGHLADEQKQMLQEMADLSRNIEHINQIVATQQNYAMTSGILEEVPVADLLEDALRMNTGAMERQRVNFIREYSTVPPVVVDKHKVLQILVNLIRNARFALDENSQTDKRIILRVGLNGNNRVKISVIDNGVGIPTENLTRIFQHGFTTRKDGHGFGLHSGALAARELGGALNAQSDGPGKGAIFTLELPYRQNAKAA